MVEAADGYGFLAHATSQIEAAGMQEFPYTLRECEEILTEIRLKHVLIS
jgi:hypothetical protein